jgi:hypothetical protein
MCDSNFSDNVYFLKIALWIRLFPRNSLFVRNSIFLRNIIFLSAAKINGIPTQTRLFFQKNEPFAKINYVCKIDYFWWLKIVLLLKHSLFYENRNMPIDVTLPILLKGLIFITFLQAIENKGSSWKIFFLKSNIFENNV